ncbi:MAG: DegT/DnrJ/EryC1/StrS family aminotransferase [Candidatus Tectomicrobia bacterium]|nr:DegT/DnrJ/EryC1/StrS family aminotransferase [Candidatus Tectomicrobia bacterium]
MSVPFVDLAIQHKSLSYEIEKKLAACFKTCDFILGEEVQQFEEEFARFCGATYGIGVASGTEALHLALKACGVKRGDEVITVTHTFIATVLAISQTGAQPVLVDADQKTHTIDVSKIESAISPRTRAIVPVHLYGHPADMDPLLQIAEVYQLKVIEDACQAHGAVYKGRRVGSLGDAGCFSFYPSKNLGAYGDGGMILTNSEELAQEIRLLRDYGQIRKYHHEIKGFNSRLDTIQASILLVKLKKLEEWNRVRRQHAELYTQLLQETDLILPEPAPYGEHVYHLYVVRSPQRDALAHHLKARGIATGIHYPIPIHLQNAYQELRYRPGDFPIAESYAQTVLSLPMYPELRTDQIQYIAESIREFALLKRELKEQS